MENGTGKVTTWVRSFAFVAHYEYKLNNAVLAFNFEILMSGTWLNFPEALELPDPDLPSLTAGVPIIHCPDQREYCESYSATCPVLKGPCWCYCLSRSDRDQLAGSLINGNEQSLYANMHWMIEQVEKQHDLRG